MAIRKIVTLGDDVLRKQCKRQEKFDKRLWTLLDDMAETMYKANGVQEQLRYQSNCSGQRTQCKRKHRQRGA